MTRRLHRAAAIVAAAIVVVVAGTVGAGAGPASAGGWAVTTLDTLPAGGLQPGRATPLGYTIRQHGVTPIELDDSALVVAMADGRALRFPGVPDGPPGHHVAQVMVPEAGRFALAVDQGWFAPQDLGHLDIGSASATPASPGSSSADGWPAAVRALLVVTTAVALVAMGAELGAARARRRRGLLGTGAGA
jgi:hypothetical protein